LIVRDPDRGERRERQQNRPRDAQAIRIFLADGHQLGCSQSYAKNMGLYGQRTGCFSIITASAAEAAAVESQMKVRRENPFSKPSMCALSLIPKTCFLFH